MSFRQDLKGYSEPKEGYWDGFQRINTETQEGGIVGVFRHGSQESERRIFINYLASEKNYEISEAISGKKFGIYSGKKLAESGLIIKLFQKYEGVLLEIKQVLYK